MQSIWSDDDFDVLMALINKQYMYSDKEMDDLFREHSLENNNLRNSFNFHKKVRDQYKQKYQPTYNPKEEPFEIKIHSNIKVK